MYKIIWSSHYFSVPNKFLLFQNKINNIENKEDFLYCCNVLLDYNDWDVFFKLIEDVIDHIHDNTSVMTRDYMWELILFHVVVS